MAPYMHDYDIWSCPSVLGSTMGNLSQVAQPTAGAPEDPFTSSPPVTRYWLWHFDRPDNPVPQDQLWGKTIEQAIENLRAVALPGFGSPDGPSDLELMVDPYFPDTIDAVPPDLRGESVHFGGRNRLFLDDHVKYIRDDRTGTD
jgi:hypothetical protein